MEDIKEHKANVTIGQLLHNNANYEKQLKAALIRRRKKNVRLPLVAVNFAKLEDLRAPEISVEIDRCTIRNVLVDGGSGVNLLEKAQPLILDTRSLRPQTRPSGWRTSQR